MYKDIQKLEQQLDKCVEDAVLLGDIIDYARDNVSFESLPIRYKDIIEEYDLIGSYEGYNTQVVRLKKMIKKISNFILKILQQIWSLFDKYIKQIIIYFQENDADRHLIHDIIISNRIDNNTPIKINSELISNNAFLTFNNEYSKLLPTKISNIAQAQFTPNLSMTSLLKDIIKDVHVPTLSNELTSDVESLFIPLGKGDLAILLAKFQDGGLIPYWFKYFDKVKIVNNINLRDIKTVGDLNIDMDKLLGYLDIRMNPKKAFIDVLDDIYRLKKRLTDSLKELEKATRDTTTENDIVVYKEYLISNIKLIQVLMKLPYRLFVDSIYLGEMIVGDRKIK
jgi:hypothetical protein